MNLSKLKTGDRLLFYGAGSLLSGIIRLGQKSKYSHELNYVGKTDALRKKAKGHALFELRNLKGKHVFIESDWGKKYGRSGVHFLDERELEERGGFHDVFCDMEVSKPAFIEAAIDHVNMKIKYDFLGLFWQAVVTGRRLAQEDHRQKIALHSTDKMYCTELGQTLNNISTLRTKNIIPSTTNPKSVSLDHNTHLVGTLNEK